MIPQLSQGGIGLSDRDYYLKDDKRSVQIREAYTKYINTLFTLTGVPQAKAQENAEAIFKIEKTLAAAQLSRVEMRDAYRTYNKFSVDALHKTTPLLNWKQILVSLKASGQDTVLVNNPSFL
ncbi:M13 family metallopeptidase N-terminal domain-containing protein [Niabella ginsengisoli]|uniref:M13 family metallopeptidase N-terminal domain-containing protein n=1 Tax=Niabella ginsengisoli TaxID=522298 RepID=UPI0021D47F01|nr:M13 family metallopeptidase N-terminal domain-containing protein [Niabella ginsengisoli]